MSENANHKLVVAGDIHLQPKSPKYDNAIDTLNWIFNNKDLNNENQKIDKEIDELEKNKDNLISAKRKIDEEVLKIDITTVNAKIEKIKIDGSTKKEKLNK